MSGEMWHAMSTAQQVGRSRDAGAGGKGRQPESWFVGHARHETPDFSAGPTSLPCNTNFHHLSKLSYWIIQLADAYRSH